jgi:hypothetical protein
MGDQPDPNAGPAGDPDPEPPASGGSPTSPTSPVSPASPRSPDSSSSPAPHDVPGTAGNPTDPTGPGGEPREELLAGFAPGGTWDARPPGPELAAAVATAAGPQWRCRGASGEQLIGMLGRLAALESWAAAGKLGVIRALIRDDDPAFLGGSRHGDLPDVWEDALTHEVALALAASVPSADKTMRSAWELGARLPEIGALLESGVLDAPKARLIAEVFQELSDESAGRAEALIVPELLEPPTKTYAQVERIATAIALLVDPRLGERRRKAAEQHRGRVTLFREQAGTAGLSGRDLPTDQALAANANVSARANQYKDSGVFGKATMDQLRVAAYLDLLTRVPAEERIAHGLLTEQTPAGPDDDDAGRTRAPEPAGGPRPGGDECPCRECDGSCLPDDDSDPDDDDPGGAQPPRGPGDKPGGESRPAVGGSPGPSPSPSLPGSRPVLQDLIFPLATLLGLADRPGEGHGLGALDPDLCRTLAATAAASPRTTICVTITDPDGIAIGHGCGRPSRVASPATGGPAPPLAALPGRINLTVTAGRLAGLAELAGRSRTGWALSPRGAPAPQASKGPPGDPDWCRTWALTLPGGRELTVRLEPVPTFGCDHRNESHAYQPSDKLRHLVQVRDYTCTFPPCSRHARDSDFEHAVPYDQGGRTCACNAGARSRKCHRVKQAPGWKVAQPRPGWHQWTTPRGRTYTQGPKRYPVLLPLRSRVGRERFHLRVRLAEGEVAGGQVTVGGEGAQRRFLLGAQVGGAGAAGAESAAGRGSDRRRELAPDALVLLGPFERRVGDRHGVDQASGVRVDRRGVDGVGRADLYQLAEVHDADHVGHVPDDGQVVRDEQIRQAVIALQVEHQVQDLRLDRDVKRGHRLVGHDHRRAQHQRSGEPEPLPLPAGELVRVPFGRGGGQPDLVQHRRHPLRLRGPTAVPLDDHRLAQDRRHPHPRVHRCVGVLEHQLHQPSLPPPLPPRQRREVPPAEYKRSAARLLQSHDQPSDGRLSAPRFPHKPKRRAGRNREGHVRDSRDLPDPPLQDRSRRNREILHQTGDDQQVLTVPAGRAPFRRPAKAVAERSSARSRACSAPVIPKQVLPLLPTQPGRIDSSSNSSPSPNHPAGRPTLASRRRTVP